MHGNRTLRLRVLSFPLCGHARLPPYIPSYGYQRISRKRHMRGTSARWPRTVAARHRHATDGRGQLRPRPARHARPFLHSPTCTRSLTSV